MSTLLANLAVGFLSGGIAGALVGYVLQHIGRVTCVVSEWKPEYFKEFREEKRSSPEEAGYFEFSVYLDFFNTKAVDTGIRGLCVLFRADDGEVIGASPLYRSEAALHIGNDSLSSVSLAANGLVSMRLYGSGNATLTRHVAQGGRIEVFGYYPSKKEFSQSIDPKRDAWSPIVPMGVRATRDPDG